MNNYPKIIDAAGKTLAILDNLIDPDISEQVNGEYTFTFTAIIEELKTDYIHYDNFIEVDDNIFLISKYIKKRTQDNKLLVNVLCEHVSYLLIEYDLENFDHTYETPTSMLSYALMGTPFMVGNVTVGGHSSIQMTQETNKREVLNHIAQNFKGEFVFDRYTISFLQQRGQNRGVEFRVGKNVKGISKTVDATVRDADGNPKVTYEIDIIELNELDDFKGLEGFSLGDTVKLFDEELGINIYARIFDIPSRNPIKKRNTKVVLGNFIDDLAKEQIGIKRTSNLVSKRSGVWDRAEAITENGTFLAQLLEGTINALQNQIFAGLGTVTITEHNGIMITDQPTHEASTSALRLLGGILAISNSKDVDGNWIWRTFGTGDGFSADHMITGTLDASVVRVENMTFGDLSGRVGAGQLDEDVVDTIDGAYNVANNAQGTANTANANANQAKEIASKTNINLARNGGAEICTNADGIPDYWSHWRNSVNVWTGRRSDQSWTISGRYSFEIRAIGTVESVGSFYQELFGFKIGQPYTLSGKIGTHRCLGRITVAFLDAAGNWLAAESIWSDAPAVKKGSVTVVSPAAATRMTVEVVKHETTTGHADSYLFADEVKVEEGSVATPYIENDLSANDTANAVANSVQKGQKFDNSIMIGNGNGIKVLDALNVARVILGQYAAGKYGIKVTNGEMFSTTFQSGAEGASEYVRIGSGYSPIQIVKNNNDVIRIFETGGEGQIRFYKNAGSELGTIGATGGSGKFYIEGGSPGGSDTIFLRSASYEFERGKLWVQDGLRVFNDKNAVVITKNYGERLMYSLEMPESRFEDIGVGEVVDGLCRIDLDPVFVETLELHGLETPYVVHLTPYDWLTLRVKEIGTTYFIVEEKEGLSGTFAWRLSGIRVGYKGRRIERVDAQDALDGWEEGVEDLFAEELTKHTDTVLEDLWEEETSSILSVSIEKDLERIFEEGAYE